MDKNEKQDSKNEEIRREALKSHQQKSELEQRASIGAQGDLELKQGEKARFLGQFKERVIKALTFSQVKEKEIYTQIEDAIKDKRAARLIINREVENGSARDYINLARKHDLSFKRVHSPEFKGDVALVVVSDQAVHESDIFVNSNSNSQNLPDRFEVAKGKKICAKCFNLVKEQAPDQLENYKKMTLLDKLLGKDCPAELDE